MHSAARLQTQAGIRAFELYVKIDPAISLKMKKRCARSLVQQARLHSVRLAIGRWKNLTYGFFSRAWITAVQGKMLAQESASRGTEDIAFTGTNEVILKHPGQTGLLVRMFGEMQAADQRRYASVVPSVPSGIWSYALSVLPDGMAGNLQAMSGIASRRLGSSHIDSGGRTGKVGPPFGGPLDAMSGGLYCGRTATP